MGKRGAKCPKSKIRGRLIFYMKKKQDEISQNIGCIFYMENKEVIMSKKAQKFGHYRIVAWLYRKNWVLEM